MLKLYNRLLCFFLKPVLNDIERQNIDFYDSFNRRDKKHHELATEVYALRRELDLLKKSETSASA